MSVPGRGSAAGVDRRLHCLDDHRHRPDRPTDLLFERFLNPEPPSSMPDIDIDFCRATVARR